VTANSLNLPMTGAVVAPSAPPVAAAVVPAKTTSGEDARTAKPGRGVARRPL